MIEDAARKAANIESEGKWEWCLKENSTYLDCPIAKYQDVQTNFIVAVHNPSMIPLKYARIALPHGNFDVYGFD